jgi:hypothetical protein
MGAVKQWYIEMQENEDYWMPDGPALPCGPFPLTRTPSQPSVPTESRTEPERATDAEGRGEESEPDRQGPRG